MSVPFSDPKRKLTVSLISLAGVALMSLGDLDLPVHGSEPVRILVALFVVVTNHCSKLKLF
jgi:hypothetical protein